LIHLIRAPASAQQLDAMLEELREYVKLAVDIRRGILTGGGALHADCEAVLLEDGSRQEDIWGADWIPATREVRYEALINIRPGQGNLSMSIQDQATRDQIEGVVRKLLGES